MEPLLAGAERWLYPIAIYVVAIGVGLLMHAIVFRIAERLTRRIAAIAFIREAVLARSRGPLFLLVPLVFVYVVDPFAAPYLSEAAEAVIGGLAHVVAVIGVAWLLVGAVLVLEDAVAARYAIGEADNLQARKIITQTRILRRVTVVIIGVLALAAILLEYEPFRELGTGLLASAGIVGIVVGIAAQRTLGNLIAGFQIAFTQPIRVDDVVIVEDEFGRVEEITLTYVVVRVWDERRIVVPITQFIEKPFENWTRETSELLGTVFLYVDPTTPIDEVRAALGRIVEASTYYDGRVWRLHVTNTTERTVELRALMSAASASDLWELRCEVREKLIGYVQEHFPEALPRVRAELRGSGVDAREPGNAGARE